MIALIAHDAKKQQLVDWVATHIAHIRQCELVATGTTGLRIAERFPDLSIKRVASGPLGGDQQIGALIVERRIQMLIFFVDPLAPMPHDVDVKALMRLAIYFNIPAAFNSSTADRIIGAVTPDRKKAEQREPQTSP